VDLRLAEREREERTRRVPLCLAQRRRRGHCPAGGVHFAESQGKSGTGSDIATDRAASENRRCASSRNTPQRTNAVMHIGPRTGTIFFGVPNFRAGVRASLAESL
jgi:hypothetical protein